ncbi:MAG: hypothetical protein V4819_24645 [Verrucomicrobiota bacterium]
MMPYTTNTPPASAVTRDKELSRIDRDTLLDSINRCRAAIQHAADALWPRLRRGQPPRSARPSGFR